MESATHNTCDRCGKACTQSIDLWLQHFEHSVDSRGDESAKAYEPGDVDLDYISICNDCWRIYIRPLWQAIETAMSEADA